MKEYKFVKIHDDSCQDDKRLEHFVDSLDIISKNHLYSVTQHGGMLALIWNENIPNDWKELESYEYYFDNESDYWVLSNEVNIEFKLPLSAKKSLLALNIIIMNYLPNDDELKQLKRENFDYLVFTGMIEFKLTIGGLNWTSLEQFRSDLNKLNFKFTEKGIKYLLSVK